MTPKKAMCLSSPPFRYRASFPPPHSGLPLPPARLSGIPQWYSSILFRISFLSPKSIFSHVKKVCCLSSSHALFLVSRASPPSSFRCLALPPFPPFLFLPSDSLLFSWGVLQVSQRSTLKQPMCLMHAIVAPVCFPCRAISRFRYPVLRVTMSKYASTITCQRQTSPFYTLRECSQGLLPPVHCHHGQGPA